MTVMAQAVAEASHCETGRDSVTMRSQEAIICECGHRGYIKCAENDQPYSSLWESYSLEGFKGGGITVTNYKDMPKDMLAALNPTCPKCGQTGKVKRISTGDEVAN
jgi:hypothetical protein